jgi:hypothetical protein
MKSGFQGNKWWFDPVKSKSRQSFPVIVPDAGDWPDLLAIEGTTREVNYGAD